MKIRLYLCIIILLLAGCAEEKTDAKLPGERIAIMVSGDAMQPDSSEITDPINLGPVRNSKAWPQMGLIPIHAIGQLRFVRNIKQATSVSIGEDNGWETRLVPTPVVGDGKVYAMDAHGYISAHDMRDLNKKIWLSDAAVNDAEELLGGGLAYANGRIFVITSYGDILALDAATGAIKWRQSLRIPFRAAPTLIGTYVLALSSTNRLYAINMANGELLWAHEGIKESANYLRVVVPAANKDVVIAPYSSGEIVALQLTNGRPLWSDTLTLPKRTRANNFFTGIGGHPIIAGDLVYAVSSSGLLVANRLANGLGVWEREISSLHTPWLAGDYIFVLTTDKQLVALNRFTGQIRWITDMAEYLDDEEGARFLDPVLSENQILLTTNIGTLVRINATDGTVELVESIAQDIASSPIIVDGTMYVVTQDAQLHALK